MWKIFDNKQMWNFYDCTWRTSSREICLGQVSSEYFGESYLIIKVSENLDKISFCFLAEYGEYDFIHDDVECVSAVCATDSFTKYHMKFKNNKVAVIKCTNESSMHSFDRYFGDLFFKDEIETQCSMCGAKAEGYMNFCCHCGAEIHKTTKGYCTKCGHVLEDGICPICEKVTYVETKEVVKVEIPLSEKLIMTHWIAGGVGLLGILANIIVSLCINGRLQGMYTGIIYGYFSGFIMMLVSTPIVIKTTKQIIKFDIDNDQQGKNKGLIIFGYLSVILPWFMAVISIFC